MTDYRKLIIQAVKDFESTAFAQTWLKGQGNNLASIFNGISIWNEDKKVNNPLPTAHYHTVGRLNIDDFEFSESNSLAKATERQTYWNEFRKEFDAIKDVEHTNTLISLLKKHLWCIPSKENSNISLYEHIRLSIARMAAKTETPQYWLVCGDITGIQSYIYGVAHSGAMKALKGRSFWLNQVVESVGHHFIESFGLPSANLIYASGGKFYALIPKVDEVELIEKRKYLQLKFKDTYESDLGLALAWVDILDSELDTDISEKWQVVNKRLDKDKFRKFGESIKTGQDLFSPLGESGQMIRCQNTKKDLCKVDAIRGKGFSNRAEIGHKLFKVGTLNLYQEPEESNNERLISEEQYLSKIMGRRIKTPNTKGDDRDVVLTVEPNNPSAAFYALKDFERFEFKNHLEEKNNYNNIGTIKRIHLWNDDDFKNVHNDPTVPKSWHFYGGNWRFDENKTFNEIIKNSEGIKRMGVLRLDLDNLGFAFRTGFGGNASFERTVQLSLMLDFFFSGYINRLRDCVWTMEHGITELKDTPQYSGEKKLSELIEIVYSGGDDVFIVGVWNVLPDVALWLNKQFHAFTGGNESFTMSAGISLFDDKFPLVKAAKESGEAEERAKGKRFKRDGVQQAEKNAVCFLDVPMSWEDFKVMRSRVAQWYDWMENGRQDKQLNHGFINRLLAIHGEFESEYERLKRGKNPDAFKKALFSKWRWHACYNLYRYAAMNKAFEHDIKNFATELFATPAHFEQDWIALLKVPALWLDLLTRKE
jgi:CRISPR-associated protein Csm1